MELQTFIKHVLDNTYDALFVDDTSDPSIIVQLIETLVNHIISDWWMAQIKPDISKDALITELSKHQDNVHAQYLFYMLHKAYTTIPRQYIWQNILDNLITAKYIPAIYTFSMLNIRPGKRTIKDTDILKVASCEQELLESNNKYAHYTLIHLYLAQKEYHKAYEIFYDMTINVNPDDHTVYKYDHANFVFCEFEYERKDQLVSDIIDHTYGKVFDGNEERVRFGEHLQYSKFDFLEGFYEFRKYMCEKNNDLKLIEQLKEENENLKAHIKYQPGGEGFHDAQTSFHESFEKIDNSFPS